MIILPIQITVRGYNQFSDTSHIVLGIVLGQKPGTLGALSHSWFMNVYSSKYVSNRF